MKRRDFLKLSAGAVAGGYLSSKLRFLHPRVFAAATIPGLSDPAAQPKFVNAVPDALSPGFIYQPDKKGRYKIKIGPATHYSGLVDDTGTMLPTPIWGYGDQKDRLYTWPGRTFQVKSVDAGGPPQTEVIWANALDGIPQHLLPVDTSLHWCYSLPGYENYSIGANGVPIITHLHGGHTDFQFDGNPEFFYAPELSDGTQVVGPQWNNVPDGFTTKFRYDNKVPAGNLWYHDHALGITRLNVYAGLAGFYFVRDDMDTGQPGNPLGLPAWPYEKAYAIQDRMFRNTGELFYPAFPGDPFYADFITGEGATLPPELFPDGGPTALAEFFGDHMVVNGKIWPYEEVEPRQYRLHLLNGTDSRFMILKFRKIPKGARQPFGNDAKDLTGATTTLNFYVVGSDQGLASSATMTNMLVSEPGSRYDIVIDFSDLDNGDRVILENLGGDAPFGGDLPAADDLFPDRQTDRIMAFDVTATVDSQVSGDPHPFNPFSTAGFDNVTGDWRYSGNTNPVNRIRKVALFEGLDEYGRLQPLLGTAEPATDYLGNPINWPAEYETLTQGVPGGPLIGQIQGSIAWHSPTTENPKLGDTEIWEIYNATGDAHPIHLHLVNFQVGTGDVETYGAARQQFTATVNEQPVVQHNGTLGNGFYLSNIVLGSEVALGPADGYVENAPKDMVTALPGEVTRIKVTFDKPGRYVWHCHILSHEDHEMMRVLQVG